MGRLDAERLVSVFAMYAGSCSKAKLRAVGVWQVGNPYQGSVNSSTGLKRALF